MSAPITGAPASGAVARLDTDVAFRAVVDRHPPFSPKEA
jgi:hypothetical protein